MNTTFYFFFKFDHLYLYCFILFAAASNVIASILQTCYINQSSHVKIFLYGLGNSMHLPIDSISNFLHRYPLNSEKKCEKVLAISTGVRVGTIFRNYLIFKYLKKVCLFVFKILFFIQAIFLQKLF